MDRKTHIDEVYNSYLETQKLLWDRWMKIAWRFEVASTPDNAWWAIPYKALDQQLHDTFGDVPANEAWLRLWNDGLKEGEGILAAMVEWNRRIIEQQAKANAEFLNAWAEAVRRFGGGAWDPSTQRAFEALQRAINEAILHSPLDAEDRPAAEGASKTSKTGHPGKTAMQRTA